MSSALQDPWSCYRKPDLIQLKGHHRSLGPGWLEQSTGLSSPAPTLAKNKSKEEKTAAGNS